MLAVKAEAEAKAREEAQRVAREEARRLAEEALVIAATTHRR